MDGVLRRVAETKEPVQMIYESKDKMLSQRTVTVSQMDEIHVLVWCHLGKAASSLEISNVLAVIPENNIKKRDRV